MRGNLFGFIDFRFYINLQEWVLPYSVDLSSDVPTVAWNCQLGFSHGKDCPPAADHAPTCHDNVQTTAT
jgi:hypothetical protein